MPLGFFPPLLPYRDGLPIPPGYRVEHRTNGGLISVGLITWLVAYGGAVAQAGADGFNNGTGWLAVPLVGPWVAIGKRSFHCTEQLTEAESCVNRAFQEVQVVGFLSADAVVQATGAILFLVGLASGREELVRVDLAGVRLEPHALGGAGFGLSADGRF